MFGYRLVRERDFTVLTSAMADLEVGIDRLLRERTTLAVEAATAQARADYCTIRLNVLETESAQMRQKLTGLPAIAATLGTTRASDPASDVLTNLEDVGDARAHELKGRGLLHDDEPGEDFPSASALAPGDEAE